MSGPNGLGGAFSSDTTRQLDFDQAAQRGCKVDVVAGELIETSDNFVPVMNPDLQIQHCVPVEGSAQ